jgi:hypothetical protein
MVPSELSAIRTWNDSVSNKSDKSFYDQDAAVQAYVAAKLAMLKGRT